MLQEKEESRLRKAKEKARMKAQQKIANSVNGVNEQEKMVNAHSKAENPHVLQYPQAAENINIAVCIDPTYSRQRRQDVVLPQRIMQQNSIPITDLGITLVNSSFFIYRL